MNEQEWQWNQSKLERRVKIRTERDISRRVHAKIPYRLIMSAVRQRIRDRLWRRFS